MTERQRLSNRRVSETFAFEWAGMPFICSFSRFKGGELAEIFVSNHKSGSAVDATARDAAVLASIGLQFGVPLEVLKGALLRDARGQPQSPVCAALDAIAAMDGGAA